MRNRQLSYTALKEIVPRLPFTTRYNLRSNWVKSLCVEPRIKSIKFFQPYGEYTIPFDFEGVDETGDMFGPQYSARLTVDSATWHFDYDDLSQQVKVTCSLYPGREIFSSDKTLAKWFFTYFMDFGVVQLELEESADPFEYVAPFRFLEYDDAEEFRLVEDDSDDMELEDTRDDETYEATQNELSRLKCFKLKWKVNGVFLVNWLLGIKVHVFKVVEIVDAGHLCVVARATGYLKAKHKIWRDEDRNSGGGKNYVHSITPILRKQLYHIKICVYRTKDFARYFEHMKTETDRWEMGSIVELSYENWSEYKRRVWFHVSEKVPGSTVVALHDREISVLEVTDDCVIYAELFEEDVLRFKLSKVARENCQLDLEALSAPAQH